MLESQSLRHSGDEEEEGEVTTLARVPRTGEVLQAMGTLRAFLELPKSEPTTFYAMENQILLKLVSTTAKQCLYVTTSPFLLLNTDCSR